LIKDYILTVKIRKVVARQGTRVVWSIHNRVPVVCQGKVHVNVELFGELNDRVQTLDTIWAGIEGCVAVLNEL
jgi:hypothetical protein